MSAVTAPSRAPEPGGVRISAAPELGRSVLLAIDTALGTSVALGVDGRVFEAVSPDPRGHAEAIGGLLAAVLTASGTAAAQVTGVVAGVGPGLFTGLRVGIAAAHAFATARDVPLLPLVSHDAVALGALEAGALAGVRVLQDARRRELFVTEYAGVDWAGIPVRGAEPHLTPRDGLVESANDIWPELVPASALVRLAARRLVAGREFDADRALYLRAPDIYAPAAPKKVGA